MSLAVKCGEFDLRCGGGVCDGDVELEGKVVAAEVVDIPAGAFPTGALGVGRRDAEPIVVVRLVYGCVGDQRLVLLLQPLLPRFPIPRPCTTTQQRDLRQRRLRPRVPPLHLFNFNFSFLLLALFFFFRD